MYRIHANTSYQCNQRKHWITEKLFTRFSTSLAESGQNHIMGYRNNEGGMHLYICMVLHYARAANGVNFLDRTIFGWGGPISAT